MIWFHCHNFEIENQPCVVVNGKFAHSYPFPARLPDMLSMVFHCRLCLLQVLTSFTVYRNVCLLSSRVELGYVYVYVSLCVFTYIYIYIHTHIYIYIYVCSIMYVDIYIYIHMFAHLYKAVSMCTPSRHVFPHSHWFQGKICRKRLDFQVFWLVVSMWVKQCHKPAMTGNSL